MRRWTFVLGGLLVWAAHFFLLYGFASLFPGERLVRTLSLAATIPALAADAALLWFGAARRRRADCNKLERWLAGLAILGAAISIVAVMWQALAAAIG
ncbi:MAG: hypothetical protein WKF52_07780 [Sphingomicrobium sp.]